jgi:hypothetical protein
MKTDGRRPISGRFRAGSVQMAQRMAAFKRKFVLRCVRLEAFVRLAPERDQAAGVTRHRVAIEPG